ncbi:MAG: sigma-70 family RNA polymerase sigma factor [Acidimicrobiales bacterium]
MVERRDTAEPDLESQFAAGDDGALEAAYAAHGALVYSYCRRMLETERAGDATQRVFVGAWRSRGRYRPDAGTIAGWLIGMARFTVIDILRADELQPPPDRPQPRDSRPPAGDATHIAKRMLVGEAIAALPERERKIVQLAIFEDLTAAQIAARYDLPLDTVKADIQRALERMRRHLEGFDHAA